MASKKVEEKKLKQVLGAFLKVKPVPKKPKKAAVARRLLAEQPQ